MAVTKKKISTECGVYEQAGGEGCEGKHVGEKWEGRFVNKGSKKKAH